MAELLYRSTNWQSPKVTFREALARGLAPDRGLYVPEFYPELDRDIIESMRDMPYPEIAVRVMKPLVGDSFTTEELTLMSEDAYRFPVPLEPVEGLDGRYILRLDRGPTASFKDYAAQMMARKLGRYLEQEGLELVILNATSGDTYAAVANAFHGVRRVKTIGIFPLHEVPPMQRKFMTTLGGNSTAIGVDANFDCCLGMVTAAFVDKDLAHIPLSSANSINVGRLVPQTVYYFHAYSKCKLMGHDGVIFSVPSGNFGDVTAGLIAHRMGLPAEFFIAAVNENDEFPRFLDTGIYEKVDPSRNCISNAMNVGNPKNLVRIVDMHGGQMDHTGKLVKSPEMGRIRQIMKSESIGDERTRKTMREAWAEHGLLLEPHGAVAWAALNDFCPEGYSNGAALVSLETAHPAKFPETVLEELGFEPDLPASMIGLGDKPETYDTIPGEYGALKELLKQRF